MLVEDVAEILWFGFASTDLAPIKAAIAEQRCRNVIWFRRNLPMRGDVVDIARVREMNAELHTSSGGPIWTAIDQEGGVVQRIKAPATVWPPMMSLAAVAEPDDVALAHAVGHALGQELAALGFDVDFAPILDVHTNPANPIIGDRAFGTTPDAVARRAIAFARGLGDAGVIACGKHFPGHGDTATDSHLELPRIAAPRARLDEVELAPFQLAARAGMPMFMTAHVVFEAISQTPATMEPRLVRDLLRREWGYSGLVVSDDLDMQAVAGMGAGPAAVAAVRAGCDLLLLCQNEAHQAEAHAALMAAGAREPEFAALLTDSATRIRDAKATHRAFPYGIDVVGCPKHQALAARLRSAAAPEAT